MKYVVTVNGEKYEVEVERVDGKSACGALGYAHSDVENELKQE